MVAALPILNRKLMIGSALFGVGGAIVGFCPGPAVASLSYAGLVAYRFAVGEVET
ncbi:MAG: DUF6691 family protein [Paracoccaceae bacterium]